MQQNLIISIILSSAIALSGCNKEQKVSSQATTNTTEGVTFACGQDYDQNSDSYIYTTFAWNPANKKAIVHWAREDFSGSGFNPKTRCQEVSPRFQTAYDNGSLNFLTNGYIDEQPVICTAKEVGGDCEDLLITLLHQDNAEETLDHLSKVFRGDASKPLTQSSGDKVTIQGDRIYVEVNIDEFLSQK
jgi:hypothetical protein